MNLGIENEFQEFKEGLGQLDKGLKSITSMQSGYQEIRTASKGTTGFRCNSERRFRLRLVCKGEK